LFGRKKCSAERVYIYIGRVTPCYSDNSVKFSNSDNRVVFFEPVRQPTQPVIICLAFSDHRRRASTCLAFSDHRRRASTGMHLVYDCNLNADLDPDLDADLDPSYECMRLILFLAVRFRGGVNSALQEGNALAFVIFGMALHVNARE